MRYLRKKSIWTWSRSKVITPNESLSIISFMSAIQIVSVFRSFSRYKRKNPFDHWSWFKVKGHSTKLKRTYDFLYVYNVNGVCVSRCFRDIWQKKFIWPLTLVQGQKSWHQMKAHRRFTICLQYKCSLYLS